MLQQKTEKLPKTIIADFVNIFGTNFFATFFSVYFASDGIAKENDKSLFSKFDEPKKNVKLRQNLDRINFTFCVFF